MVTPRDDNEAREFLLSQYLDGDLDAKTRAELERELETDPELAAELEALRQADRLIQTWAGPQPELDWDRFAAEVSRRQTSEDAWRQRSRALRLYVPLAAAAAIVLAVTMYFSGQRTPPADTTRPVAVVAIQRGIAWQDDPQLGDAVVAVSFNRTATHEALVTRPRDSIAVAAAGASPPVARTTVPEATPYF